MTEHEEMEAPREEQNAGFLMPKLPPKKVPANEQPKVKSAITKLNSMIPPSTESYVVPVSASSFEDFLVILSY